MDLGKVCDEVLMGVLGLCYGLFFECMLVLVLLLVGVVFVVC